MHQPSRSTRFALAALALLAALLPGIAVALEATHWTEVYQASPAYYDFSGAASPALQKVGDPPAQVGTVRFSFRIAIGGPALRLRFSNEAGRTPLTIDAATVALGDDATGAPVGPFRQIRFGGAGSITIPAGAPAISDAVALATKPSSTLVVSVYTTSGVKLVPMGGARMLLAAGDQSAAPGLQGVGVRSGRPVVSGVAVSGARSLPVVVAFGDSITDGLRRKTDQLQGYPEELARRFAALPPARRHSVVNAGIGGNRVLAPGMGDSALARLDRDVLRIPNVSHILLLEGINDIGNSGGSAFGPGPVVTADDLIAAYRQLIERCHQRGIKVIGATILPFKGAGYYSPEKDTVRIAVNRWIRESHAFDGVVDFAAMVADPGDPLKYDKAFDSGDHLHPSNAGYKAMGDAVDLALFR